jgi:tetratricopeptide (TPR) repeat protein
MFSQKAKLIDSPNQNIKKPRKVISYLAVLITGLIWVTAALFPQDRLWGVSHLAYLTTKYFVLDIALIILFISILVGNIQMRRIQRIYKSIASWWKQQPQILRFILTAVCALLLFWEFRDRTKLLGDGILRIGDLAGLGLDKLFSTSAAEPLDYLIHYTIYKYICLPLGLDATFCYEIISYLAGLIYLWAAWSISQQLKGRNVSFQFIFIYLLGWGGIQMFFGYAEEYGLAASVLLLFINYAIRYIYKGKGIISVAIIFIIGFFLHNLLLILFPSIAFLLFREYKVNKKRALAILISTILPIAIWLAVSYSKKESGAFLLPGSGTETGYLLWSGAHLLDMLNEIFLIIPAFLIMITLQTNFRKFDDNSNRLSLAIGLASLSALAVLIVVDPQLGMARDWDLFALPLLALNIALFLRVNWSDVSPLLKSVIAFVMIGFTFLMVQINADQNLAIKRYENILPLDYARGRYGYDRLGFYFVSHGQLSDAEIAYQESIRIKPHPRTLLNLAYVEADLGKKDEAIINLKKLLELKPVQPIALYDLGSMYCDIGQYQNALEYLLKFQETPEGKAKPDLADMIEKVRALIKKNKP